MNEKLYFIFLETDLYQLESRPYLEDTYYSCLDSAAWTCNYCDAKQFSKEEADAVCNGINEAFRQSDEETNTYYYKNTRAVVCEYEEDQD